MTKTPEQRDQPWSNPRQKKPLVKEVHDAGKPGYVVLTLNAEKGEVAIEIPWERGQKSRIGL